MRLQLPLWTVKWYEDTGKHAPLAGHYNRMYQSMEYAWLSPVTWNIWHQKNRSISQIPQRIAQISCNAPLCSRNVHKCTHLCYKMMNYDIWDWWIAGFWDWPVDGWRISLWDRTLRMTRDRDVLIAEIPNSRQFHFDEKIPTPLL